VNRIGSLLLALDELDRDGEGQPGDACQSGDGPAISDLIGQRHEGNRACVVSESGRVLR
jgi:hypothetical protein